MGALSIIAGPCLLYYPSTILIDEASPAIQASVRLYLFSGTLELGTILYPLSKPTIPLLQPLISRLSNLLVLPGSHKVLTQ